MSFRKRFNNRKSSLNRLSRRQRGIVSGHLYAHFCEPEHKSLKEMQIKIIGNAGRNDPTEKEGFWVYKLDSFILRRLNLRNFI